MRVERELEIGKWLKTAETDIEIKPNQYFALVKLLEDFHNEQLRLYGVINWVAYDFMNLESRPPKYGKYLVVRKDGKTHWETWNGSGWAYNEKVIRYWAVIQPPCL